MRGVVAVYTRKLRFLYEDCVKTLARLNALAAPNKTKDRHLLDAPENGSRAARATVTQAYDEDVLMNPEFDRHFVSQGYVNSQAFDVVPSDQLERDFDVFEGGDDGDANFGNRFVARNDARINLVELQMPADDEQHRIDEEYEYEFAVHDDPRYQQSEDEDGYQLARVDDAIMPMPLDEEDEEQVEEPIGTQLKRMREQQDAAIAALPAPKKFRRAMPQSRSRVFIFDERTHVTADAFRQWLTDTNDITKARPDIDNDEAMLGAKDTVRDHFFHASAFKLNPVMAAQSALELFVKDPAAMAARFEQFEHHVYEPNYQSDEENVDGINYNIMFDEHGNVRSTEKMRAVLSAQKRSTPGSFDFNAAAKKTPSTLLKSARSSGFFGPGSDLKFSGMKIPEDAEEEFSYDNQQVPGSEISFGMFRSGGSKPDARARGSQASLMETEEYTYPDAEPSPQELTRGSHNLLQFLTQAVFKSRNDSELESITLTDLCVVSHLSRAKAARLFYQTLVLIGADYISAFQDDSEPFGEITLIPGPRFEFANDD